MVSELACEPGYATYQDQRLQPVDIPENNDLECFEVCTHARACERLYKRCVDARQHFGWLDDMVRYLACEVCDEFEE